MFLKIIGVFKDDRVKAKDAVKKIKNIIKGDKEGKYVSKLTELQELIEQFTIESEALKIVINRIYGALKDINDFLFDPKATYETTFNGQLSLLALIEDLEMEGITCISANTDGIVCKVNFDKVDTYYKVCKEWEERTLFQLEYTNYDRYVRNNVNNYIAVKEGFYNKYNALSDKDKSDEKIISNLERDYVKTKGVFSNEVSFSSGFIHPVVSMALKDYALYKTDYREYVTKHIALNKFNIYDYCISQKVDKKFEVVFMNVIKGIVKEETLQQYNRFYVCSKGGGSILKKDEYKGKLRSQQLLAKTSVQLFNDFVFKEEYHVDFRFYIQKVEEFILYKKSKSKQNKREGFEVRNRTLFSDEYD